eukprot:COSAG01_NODE_399_length_17543_cov_15.077792_20_plen_75_part_00
MMYVSTNLRHDVLRFAGGRLESRGGGSRVAFSVALCLWPASAKIEDRTQRYSNGWDLDCDCCSYIDIHTWTIGI